MAWKDKKPDQTLWNMDKNNSFPHQIQMGLSEETEWAQGSKTYDMTTWKQHGHSEQQPRF